MDIAFCFAVLRGTGPSFLYGVLFVHRVFYFLFYMYKMVRYVCLDFETNGFPEKDCKPMPWSSYPIQVSLTAVENGEVVHLYDSHIQLRRGVF